MTGDGEFVRPDNDFHVMKVVDVIEKIVSASDTKSRKVRTGLFFEGCLSGIITPESAETLGFSFAVSGKRWLLIGSHVVKVLAAYGVIPLCKSRSAPHSTVLKRICMQQKCHMYLSHGSDGLAGSDKYCSHQ